MSDRKALSMVTSSWARSSRTRRRADFPCETVGVADRSCCMSDVGDSKRLRVQDQLPGSDAGWLRKVEVGFVQPVDLQQQVVILVSFANPFHTDAPGSSHCPMVSGPYDCEDLANAAVLKRLVRYGVTGLGSVALPPSARNQLPRDLQIGTPRR